jgi:EpsD family peptidyl-prolyl cis-trans isomerase
MRIEMLAILASGTMLAGCGPAAADRAGEQLVARVNGVEISARQLAPGNAGIAQAVEKVIDRELLVQKALAAGLERDPQVLAQIDNARREVLAQAWIERAARSAAKPSRDEVRAFYAENPALFAERRIYRTREISVAGPADMVDALRSQAASTRDIDELAAWLRARGASAVVVGETQPAEQRPLAFLPVLARMRPGDLAVLSTPSGATVIQLVEAQDAPLSIEQAAPLIETFLAGRRRMALAEAEVKRLRETARIEYVAQFKR